MTICGGGPAGLPAIVAADVAVAETARHAAGVVGGQGRLKGVLPVAVDDAGANVIVA